MKPKVSYLDTFVNISRTQSPADLYTFSGSQKRANTGALKKEYKMKALIFFATLLLSLSSRAAAIHECGELNRIENLMQSKMKFAQGEVSLAYVTTEEPAAHPDHLLVFVSGPEMSVNCFAISASAEGSGFAGIDMKGVTASYDTTRGLLIKVPVANYYTGTGHSPVDEILKIRVNRATYPATVSLDK